MQTEKKRRTPQKQTAVSQETPFHVKTCLCLCEKDEDRLMDDLVSTARGVQGEVEEEEQPAYDTMGPRME